MTTQEQSHAAATVSPAAASPTGAVTPAGASTIAGTWRMLPGVAQILEAGTWLTREDLVRALGEEAELLAGPDRTIWRVLGQVAVLTAGDQPLVLVVIPARWLHAGRLAPEQARSFVPVRGALMDELRTRGLTRAVVAGTVKHPDRTVEGPDGVRWCLRGPFRALVGRDRTVLRFELDEGELPKLLNQDERRERHARQARRQNRQQHRPAPR